MAGGYHNIRTVLKGDSIRKAENYSFSAVIAWTLGNVVVLFLTGYG